MLGMKDQLHAFCAASFGLVWLIAGIFAIRKAIQLWRSKTGSSLFRKTFHFLLVIISAWLLTNMAGMAMLVCADRFSQAGWLAALQLIAGIRWIEMYFYNPLFALVFAPFWLLGLLFWIQKQNLARGLFLVAIGSVSSPGWESLLITLTVAALSFLAWFLAVFGMSDTGQATGYPAIDHHDVNS